MSDEPELQEFKRLVGEVRDKAVEAERQRMIMLCKQLEGGYARQGETSMSRGCRRCAQALEEGAEPSSPESTTIATMIAKLAAVSNANWNTIREDLQELVREQARRDAAICARMAGTVARQDYHDAILKAAGLE